MNKGKDEPPGLPADGNWAMPHFDLDDSEEFSRIAMLKDKPEGDPFAPTIKGLPYHTHGLGRRERLSKSTVSTYPYASICVIADPWGGRGTGFLIQGNRIVTAAHVINTGGSRTVYFPNRAPITVKAAQLKPHDQHKVDGDPFDYGVINMDPFDIAGLAVLPLVPVSNQLIAACFCELAGFPVDQTSMVRYPKHGQPAPPSLTELELDGNVLIHSLDATNGQSGSPIIARPHKDPQKLAVIGVHTAGGPDGSGPKLNRAVPVTSNWV